MYRPFYFLKEFQAILQKRDRRILRSSRVWNKIEMKQYINVLC